MVDGSLPQRSVLSDDDVEDRSGMLLAGNWNVVFPCFQVQNLQTNFDCDQMETSSFGACSPRIWSLDGSLPQWSALGDDGDVEDRSRMLPAGKGNVVLPLLPGPESADGFWMRSNGNILGATFGACSPRI